MDLAEQIDLNSGNVQKGNMLIMMNMKRNEEKEEQEEEETTSSQEFEYQIQDESRSVEENLKNDSWLDS